VSWEEKNVVWNFVGLGTDPSKNVNFIGDCILGNKIKVYGTPTISQFSMNVPRINISKTWTKPIILSL